MITKIFFFLSFKTEKENQNCAAEVYTFVEKKCETDELKHDVTKNSQGIY